MIQACAGVDVIPQGPLEGAHMVNGRMGMIVKRHCRALRFSAEHDTGVCIADDSP